MSHEKVETCRCGTCKSRQSFKSKHVLERDDWLQIKMAAAGCISGVLGEWPMLHQALHQHGIDLPPSVTARTLTRICRLLNLEMEMNNG